MTAPPRPPAAEDSNDGDDPEGEALDLLLEALHLHHGYDFRSYSRSHMRRQVAQFRIQSGASTLQEITERVLQDRRFVSRFVAFVLVGVTGMFRDPGGFRAIREHAFPRLRTYHHVTVWHAGCATGEEVYSLAILLHEAGLYDRATIHATDLNEIGLQKARAGTYPLAALTGSEASYEAAGGASSLTDYYEAADGLAHLSPSLKRGITFSKHNLVTDRVFGEVHLVLCRNVLIYFDRDLQARALRLFADSLVPGGFLCLGPVGRAEIGDLGRDFELVDREGRLFRKRTLPELQPRRRSG